MREGSDAKVNNILFDHVSNSSTNILPRRFSIRYLCRLIKSKCFNLIEVASVYCITP
jgi:hypothetical protein